MDKTIPGYLLTGILGSGKTTLLNYILNNSEGQRFAVIVNEFGTIDVDGEVIETSDGPQISMANGCICCTIRNDLEETVISVLENNPQLDGLIIEASGVADPQPVANTFLLSESLRALVRMDSIITVVDLEAFPLLKGNHAFLARRQVASADLVLFNKADLVDEEQFKRVESSLLTWVPKLRAIRCTQARVPLDLLLGSSRFCPQQLPEGPAVEIHVHASGTSCHHHSSDQLALESWTFEEEGEFQVRALASLLKSLPLKVYRAKGLVRLQEEAEQIFEVQLCGTRLDIRPAKSSNRTQNQLVFLAEEGAVDEKELSEKLRDAMSRTAQTSPSMELFEKVKRLLEEKPIDEEKPIES